MTVSEGQREEFQSRLLAWADKNLRDFPWRKNVTPYQHLVAEVLLQQTLASKVEPIYEEFLERYPNLSDLVNVQPGVLAELLDPLGFQNIRAEALVDNAERIDKHGMPTDAEELSDLRYVGDYGVNATLCFGYGERRPIVDVNVIRTYNRAFGLDFENAQDDCAWEFAERMLPEENYRRYNLALLDFGALVCTSGTPNCEQCFFNDLCVYYQLNH